jgi:hypothetical protein
MTTIDTKLVDIDDWVLFQRRRYPGEVYKGRRFWYLMYHKHGGDLSPLMSPINADGKPKGYVCMTCQAPAHEGLSFLQRMMVGVNDEAN